MTEASPADRLAAAVRCWVTEPITGNLERMIAALEAYERAVLRFSECWDAER